MQKNKKKTLLDLLKLVLYIIRDTYTFPKLLWGILVKIFDNKFSKKTIGTLTVVFGTVLFLEADKKEHLVPFYIPLKKMTIRSIQSYINDFSSGIIDIANDFSIDISFLIKFISSVVSSDLFKIATLLTSWGTVVPYMVIVSVDFSKKTLNEKKFLKDVQMLDRWFRIMATWFFLGMVTIKDSNYVWFLLPLFWSYYACIMGVIPFRFSQWLLKKAFKLIISYQKSHDIPECLIFLGECDTKPYWPSIWFSIASFIPVVVLILTGHIFTALALATVATTLCIFEDYRQRGFQLEEDE